MSLVIADTNHSPIGIEVQDLQGNTQYNYTDMSELAKWRNALSHPICGCCGANATDDINKFNRLGVADMWYYNYGPSTPLLKNFNRGVLLMVNPPVDQIKQDPRYPVDLVKCGKDTLAIRLRMDNSEYVSWETMKGEPA